MKLDLSNDEALVLFEWLARIDERDVPAFEDPAEEQVLWSMLAQLETLLVEPLQPNYSELLQQARARIRGSA